MLSDPSVGHFKLIHLWRFLWNSLPVIHFITVSSACEISQSMQLQMVLCKNMKHNAKTLPHFQNKYLSSSGICVKHCTTTFVHISSFNVELFVSIVGLGHTSNQSKLKLRGSVFLPFSFSF